MDKNGRYVYTRQSLGKNSPTVLMSYLSHLNSHSACSDPQRTSYCIIFLLPFSLLDQIINYSSKHFHQTIHYRPDLGSMSTGPWRPGSQRCQNKGSQHQGAETKSNPNRTLAQSCGLAMIGITSVVLAACISRLTSGRCTEAAQILKWVEVFSWEQDEIMGTLESDKVNTEWDTV